MANFDAVKSKVRLDVKTNGNEDITGASLQEDLIAMLDVSQEADNERKAKEAELEAKDTEQDGQIALKADKATTEAKDAQQDAEIAKKLNTADAVGKKTAEGGILFNYGLRAGENAVAEGYSTEATGVTAHAEGNGTSALEDATHSEGVGTIAKNVAEHAQGAFNKSNTNTIDSVGIGTSNSNRKNATETMSNGKHYILNIGGYNGTNPTTAKDIATFLNGGGALRALYEAAGATWDSSTGLYALNGLNDITEEQMLKIMAAGRITNSQFAQAYSGYDIRTNLATLNYWYSNSYAPLELSAAFLGCKSLEVACLSGSQYIELDVAGDMKAAFYDCSALREVVCNTQYGNYAKLRVDGITSYTSAFYNCKELQEIRLWGVKANISFKYSPKLSEDTLLYLINNEAAESQITITLESSAYDRLNASQNVKNALAAHPNIKLAK